VGRVLTVRVSVTTYREEDVFRSWPHVCDLAWPGKGQVYQDGWKPNPAMFASPVFAGVERRGVVELAQGMLEEFRLGGWNAATIARVKDEITRLAALMTGLDQALGDWQPQTANTVTNKIEDCLDSLEEKLNRFYN